jgi:AcrR family transcriptional regulator
MTSETRTKRPYMASPDRRRQLLEAAGRLVAKEGMTGFTMVALAREANVSRPLVYRHFPDLETFFAEFFSDQGQRYMKKVDEAHEATPGLPAMLTAYRNILEMPDGDLRAMTTLVHDMLDPRLATARAWFRERTMERWKPIVRDMEVDDDVLNAALWTIVGAALSIGTLVRIGDLTEDQGQQLLLSLATGTMSSLAAASGAN